MSVPLIDEYTLASRLSYFLWSSMPDAKLFRLAEGHVAQEKPVHSSETNARRPAVGGVHPALRRAVAAARNIETVPINAFAVIYRDRPSDPEADRYRARLQELNRRFPHALTDNEKKELKRSLGGVLQIVPPFPRLRDERRVSRAIPQERDGSSSDRAPGPEPPGAPGQRLHVPERAAGETLWDRGRPRQELRLVTLPPKSPRGGVLTQGTRTGRNLEPGSDLPSEARIFHPRQHPGDPPAAPAAEHPPLEEAAKEFAGRTPTLRETLELHRKKPSCSSATIGWTPGVGLENSTHSVGGGNGEGQSRAIRPEDSSPASHSRASRS